MEFNLDPVFFSLGPLQVRWYGLMYVIGFVWATMVGKKLVDEGFFPVKKQDVDTLITYSMIGIFLGARIAYVFIYNWDHYINNPSEIWAIWKGGLSYHGAFAGLFFALLLFAKRVKLSVLQVWDAGVLMGALSVFFGRLGNFINGELWGRVSDVPWAFIFPTGGASPRHPSQLYEAVGEGLIVFIILWTLKNRMTISGILASWYPILYGIARFSVEFFREPDVQMGYYLGFLTMGQILCLLMIALGIGVRFYATKRNLVIQTSKTPFKVSMSGVKSSG
ncbi:MAG: prolipoprotein diacylglyceryl transferase [Epsilonproteobacteria bacterium]|nr:MAG: prolipoprotein diacylglyceryl transferase [Campylobacterota bacterium]